LVDPSRSPSHTANRPLSGVMQVGWLVAFALPCRQSLAVRGVVRWSAHRVYPVGGAACCALYWGLRAPPMTTHVAGKCVAKEGEIDEEEGRDGRVFIICSRSGGLCGVWFGGHEASFAWPIVSPPASVVGKGRLPFLPTARVQRNRVVAATELSTKPRGKLGTEPIHRTIEPEMEEALVGGRRRRMGDREEEVEFRI
ncbi:hypothetical protein GW17_00041040, partial [Ensete ventricosum]